MHSDGIEADDVGSSDTLTRKLRVANCSGPNRRQKILHLVTARPVVAGTRRHLVLLPRVWKPVIPFLLLRPAPAMSSLAGAKFIA